MLIAFLLLLAAGAVNAAVYCNSSQSCPQDKPCCSQYGECGSGSYCLGGCNPAFSYNIKACMPMPMCKDSSTNFKNYSSKLGKMSEYLGDAEDSDWIYEGYTLDYDDKDDDALILAMPKNTAGTVISSTRYIWYGKVSAKLKSSHLGGVVTAFILFSSVQDEIDFEYVGADLETVQTNYYFQGTLNYTNSKNISASDTFENYHTYEVDWHEDHVTWSVDGVAGRTLFKNQTYNETTDSYDFPQTPARVQISLWPGGDAANPPGTIAWAGGLINWDADDLKDPGYYYMFLHDINVTCYDPPKDTKVSGNKSYSYVADRHWLQDSVVIGNNNTVLASSDGSGLDDNEKKSSSSSKASSSTESSHSKSSTSSSSKKSSSSSSSSTSTSTSTSKGGSSATSRGSDSSTSTTTEGGAPVGIPKAATTSSTASLSPEQQTGFVQNIKTSGGGTAGNGGASSTNIAAGSHFMISKSNDNVMKWCIALLGVLAGMVY